MTVADRWLVADTDDLVAPLIERVASRLVEAIELDESARSDGADRPDRAGRAASSLAADPRRQQLLVGAWLSEELATINQVRLAGGERPLDPTSDRAVRARVVAELTGAGPLEPYINDVSVEEIDVNSHESTWITFVDGRKLDVGALWSSAAELTAYQKRLARRMTRTGEGRLDTSSPMSTF
ncbi:MAG TPA: hypothetical protein VNO51_19085, partial [Ilumatobacteraceae bacterium]|nr:hypothetical protein [Ilumatobacteraceae bacterium]